MNPKLIKFAVDLQNGEKIEEKKNDTKVLSKAFRELTIFLKPAKVTVRNDNTD